MFGGFNSKEPGNDYGATVEIQCGCRMAGDTVKWVVEFSSKDSSQFVTMAIERASLPPLI